MLERPDVSIPNFYFYLLDTNQFNQEPIIKKIYRFFVPFSTPAVMLNGNTSFTTLPDTTYPPPFCGAEQLREDATTGTPPKVQFGPHTGIIVAGGASEMADLMLPPRPTERGESDAEAATEDVLTVTLSLE